MPADVVLLALVALWRLVIVPRLLLLWCLPLSTVVELASSILGVSLGTTIGIVSRLATSKARITISGNRGVVPHRCPSRGVLAILRKNWGAVLTDQHAELVAAGSVGWGAGISSTHS
jgi:hypothetical protein